MASRIISLSKGKKEAIDWLTVSVESYCNSPSRLLVRVSASPTKIVSLNWSAIIRLTHVCPTDSTLTVASVHRCNRFALSSQFVTPKCCGDEAKFVLSVELNDGTTTLMEEALTDNRRFLDPVVAAQFNANCKIVFEDSAEPLYVNRELLAVYSPVFRAMFEGDFKEKNAEEMHIRDIKKDDFLAFLSCLYHPPVSISYSNAASVLLVADKYDCSAILTQCEEFLLSYLPRDGMMYKTYIEYADRYRFPNLLKRVIFVVPGDILAALLDAEWIATLQQTTSIAIHDKIRDCFGRRTAKRNREPDEPE